MRRSAVGLAWLLAVSLAGCAGLGPGARPPRLSELAAEGDPARRASTRLLLRGLEADEQGSRAAALSSYERAVQVDPNNPFAYLALARHAVEQGDAGAALAYLDRAEALLSLEGERGAGAQVHVVGLRGAALRERGDLARAQPLLDQARERAPASWGDGFLDASELR